MSRRVLVTGGATGIGAAIVRELVAAGYAVDLTYNSSAEEAERLAASLRGQDAQVATFKCNLANEGQVEQLCASIDAGSHYYALVHNAGVKADSLAGTLQLETAKDVMQVNFWSFTQLVKAVLPSMQRAKEGRIVVTSSIAAHRGLRGNGAYAASKGALEAYCRCLVDETARKGITVNTLAPGVITTAMTQGKFFEDGKDALQRRIPARSLGTPDDVARITRFLLEPGARYINGSNIAVDGGLAATMGIP
jgi:3-oxoacyl-[acyl-carrier protein] reductase